MYVRLGMFLHTIDAFDPGAFRLTSAEAAAMDPQQRLLLEQTSSALENSEMIVGSLADTKTGVYVGCMYQEYTQLQFNHGLRINPAVVTGNGISYLVGRLSYTFGLAGPCVSTDTACSSSLVAAHQAHKGVLAGEAVAAVAAGVNAMVLSITTASIAGMGALSPVARCKTFDASADGYGRGEGFAVFVLAPAQHAQQATAVVRGSAINQDGRSSGLTAPNGPSQTTLIRDVLISAGVKAQDVAYLALHGTGTPLGDPIEVNALGQAFRQPRGSTRSPLVLGSVKSCFGHTEGAAGLTGALLAVQALHHKDTPAIMHLRNMNPYVDSALGDWGKRAGMQASVARQLGAQPSIAPRAGEVAAGTSSFGMGGTNTHLLVAVPSPKESGLGTTRLSAMQRVKLWPAPPPSHFLVTALAMPRNKRVVIAVDMLCPVLGAMFDHRVQGHVIVPGAALFEAALSSARVLDKTGSNSVVALDSSILAPVMLSSQEKAMQLEVDISLAQGSALIQSSYGAHMPHFSCKFGKMANVEASSSGGVHSSSSSSTAAIATASSRKASTGLLRSTVFGSFPSASSIGNVNVSPIADPDGYCLLPALFDSCLHAGAALAPVGADVRVPTGAAAVSALTEQGQKLSQVRVLRVTCSVDVAAGTSSYAASGALSIQGLAAKPLALKPVAKAQPIFIDVPQVSNSRRNSRESKPRHTHYAVQLQASTIAPVLGNATATAGAAGINLAMLTGGKASNLNIISQRCPGEALSTLLAALQKGVGRAPAGARVGLDTIGAQSSSLALPTAPHCGLSSAAAWGLTRVAASEMPGTVFQGIDVALEAPAAYRGGSAAATGLSGNMAQGGAILKPLLLPVQEPPVADASEFGADLGGRVLVTGGLGGKEIVFICLLCGLLQLKVVSVIFFFLMTSEPPFSSIYIGIGVLLAIWLTHSGADEVVLLGRTGTFSATPASQLLNHHAPITAVRCNATLAEDVYAAFHGTSPVNALFHAGGMLQDGIFMRQTASGLRSVMAPKLTFLSHCYKAAAGNPVTQVNLFSSVSGFLGSPGQANYAASNAGLNHWAQLVQNVGVSGSSVQWGAWAQVGMAHGNTAVLTRVEKSGLGVVNPNEGLAALGAVLRESPSGRLVDTLVSPLNFSVLLKGLEEVPAIFDAVLDDSEGQESLNTSRSTSVSSSAPTRSATEAAAGAAAAVVDVRAITEDIQRAVFSMIGADVAPDQPLMEAGLDSLASVELRNELGSLFGVSMPATVTFDYPTVSALAGFVASKTRPVALPAANAAALSVLSQEQAVREAVGVLSVSCRYPHSIHSMEAFSLAALDAADLPQVVPWSRWNIDRFYSPVAGGNNGIYARFGAFINGVELFDAQLFALPRAEALAIDPQQRLLLEETHGALTQLQTTKGSLYGSETGMVANYAI